MKILALGDIHGRDIWKRVDVNQWDKVVFIGDYCDTHEGIPVIIQIDNLEDIINFKKANLNKVVLLIGNHDYHYLPGIKESYSGYQPDFAFDIGSYLNVNKNLFQLCYVQDGVLYSHAGVTKTWAKNNRINLNHIETSINNLFKHKPLLCGFTPGINYDCHGDEVCQSPTWVRPRSLALDRIGVYKQVVGHTTMEDITLDQNHPTLAFIDTLGVGKCLQVLGGEFKEFNLNEK